MRIFNENMTQEIFNPNLELGYLKVDKLFVKHYEATPFKRGKTAQEIAQELESQGVGIEIGYDGKPYQIIEEGKDGGRTVQSIKDEPDIPAKEAYDEYEDIQVYVPYTAEKLKKIADDKRYAELKAELVRIKEDIEQEAFGFVRDDYADKKARAAEIINELRVLEGKEPRKLRRNEESKNENS